MGKMSLFAALLAPAFLSACGALASLEQPGTENERLASIHAGLDKVEVRRIAGTPDLVTARAADGAELWVYRTQNEMHEAAEYDVAFGHDGRVARVSTLQLDEPG
jgi:hypothetical protein